MIDLDRLPYVTPKKNARFLLEMEVSGSTLSYHVIKGLNLLKCKTIDVYTIIIKKINSLRFNGFLATLPNAAMSSFLFAHARRIH